MPSELELWAGAECSVVRVGDAYVDQIVRTGHEARLEDFDRLAALGVRAVRLPVLWERTAPDGIASADWSWSDAALARVRRLGMRPIVGLVHHGSGPRHTSLLEASFVRGLGEFAGAVAARYPWVEDFTPVNEPLTTARFSGLYGVWYPHARSSAAFALALLHECEATRAAMRAIRAHTPGARLVQTEDLGRVSSTPRLAYQARFENLRRFASLDLLTGRLDRAHPLFAHFVGDGVDPARLDDLARDPCPPDLLGVNYYVTSDRFLDDAVDAYPPHVVGGNGRDVYADVEAVRVKGAGIEGHRRVLSVLWRRYRLPLAITEVHLGCAPEEQVRWLLEAWRAASSARRSGVDVRAITAWSAFGAVDWDSLLTRGDAHYEPGLFDVRDGHVRPTALATVARELASSGSSSHPVLTTPGWWRRPERFAYPPIGAVRIATKARPRPILLTGGRGVLGTAIARVAALRSIPIVSLSRAELDVTDEKRIAETLARVRPWAVINAAGYVRVDDAEHDGATCWRETTLAARALANACAARGVRLVGFSSDLVFDGRKMAPYVEQDAVAPLSAYGLAKAEAERILLALHHDTLVVRSGAFFGPWDEKNFVTRTLVNLRAERAVHVADDVVVSPTYLPDLASAVLTLLIDGASGVWHVANQGALTWAELALRAAKAAGVATTALGVCAQRELRMAAPIPEFSALSSELGIALPGVDDALERYCRAIAC